MYISVFPFTLGCVGEETVKDNNCQKLRFDCPFEHAHHPVPHTCVADAKGTSVVISCWWSVLPSFTDFGNIVSGILKLLSSGMLFLCLWQDGHKMKCGRVNIKSFVAW